MATLIRASGGPAPRSEPVADIIFVHGLGGDAFKTWKNAGFDWPECFAHEFPNRAVWRVSYVTSAIWNKGMTYQDQAKGILDCLLNEDLGQRPITFICHSLGGIIVKQLLRKAQGDPKFSRFYKGTRSVAFVATPHTGSLLATLLDGMRLSSREARGLRADDSALGDLNEWFRAAAETKPILTVAYAETQRVWRLASVVSPSYADPGLRDWVNPIAADHIGISKPEGTLSQIYKSIARLVRDTPLATDDWSSQDDHNPRKGFATRGEYFAPSEGTSYTPRLFDYKQTLVGRAAELESLHSFLLSQNHTIAIIAGRGGIGKTKLLYTWTDNISGFSVRFVLPEPTWSRESYKELPTGNLLIIADDAHRLAFLAPLLILIQNISQESARRVKLLLSCRPSGLGALRSVLSQFFDATAIIELPRIEKLARADVSALAKEQLGPEKAYLSDSLVSISADTPLVTVVGARLVRMGKLSNGAFTNEDSFRHAVFDRFLDEYTTALPCNGFPWRKLIHLMSALSPAGTRSESFLVAVEAFLSLPRHEVSQALGRLEDHGLLVAQDNNLRIAPDTLADYLLEGACIDIHGNSTGYADAVFQAFRSYDLASLLSNLAELEWRLGMGGGGDKILTSIWRTIETDFRVGNAPQRCDLLRSLKGAAIFQPLQTIRIVRIAMGAEAKPGLAYGFRERTQRDVLAMLPDLLTPLAHHEAHTEESVKRLFQLTADLPAFPAVYPFHADARGTLLELAAYREHKPINFLSKLAEVVGQIARDPGAFAKPFTPLNVLDQLLKREAKHENVNEWVVHIRSAELNAAVVLPLRRKVLAIIEESLGRADPRQSALATMSLSHVLAPFQPLVGRVVGESERRWQDGERLVVLDIFERRIERRDAPVPLLRQLKHALRLCRPDLQSEAVNLRVQDVLRAIPDSEALSAFDAFCTSDHEFRIYPIDFDEQVRLAEEWRRLAVKVFLETHPDVVEQISELGRMARWSDEYEIAINDSALRFIELLCSDSHFIVALIESLLGNPHPRLGFNGARVVLPLIRGLDSGQYERVGIEFARSQRGDVAWGAAHGVCSAPILQKPIQADLAIIDALARHSDPNVRNRAIFGAGRVGRHALFQEPAAAIVATTDVAGDLGLAESVCDAFGEDGIPVSVLTHAQIQSILAAFIAVNRFTGVDCNFFFSEIAAQAPDLLFNFFFERLRRYSELRHSSSAGYAPWSGAEVQSFFEGVPPPSGFAHQLRTLLGFMVEDPLPQHLAAELFWAVTSAASTARNIVSEWRNSGEPVKLRCAEYLDRHQPEIVVAVEANNEDQDGHLSPRRSE